MTHGVTIQGHTAHAGGSTHLPIPAATNSGRDIHADLERVHGRVCPIVLRDPTPDALAPETKRAQADVKRYAAPVKAAPAARELTAPPQPAPRREPPQQRTPRRPNRNRGETRSPHRATIVALHQQGKTAQEIAAATGLAYSTVNWHLRTAGIDRGNPREHCGDVVKALAQRLTDLGIKPAAVRTWARANGHTVGNTGAVPGHLIDAYLAAQDVAS